MATSRLLLFLCIMFLCADFIFDKAMRFNKTSLSFVNRKVSTVLFHEIASLLNGFHILVITATVVNIYLLYNF